MVMSIVERKNNQCSIVKYSSPKNQKELSKFCKVLNNDLNFILDDRITKNNLQTKFYRSSKNSSIIDKRLHAVKNNCNHSSISNEAKDDKTNHGSQKHDKNLTIPMKQAKKKRSLTICTSNSKCEVVRRVAARYGMKEDTEDSNWNLYWTDSRIGIERAKNMKRFQKVNHFPGMVEICKKDLLARNLNRMLKLFPKDYNFFPKTWCFPTDFNDAIMYSKGKRTKTYIIKPDTGSEGRGIYLTKNLKDINLQDRVICQVYVSRPYIIDGFKFDLRVYVLITSCDPLRIYVYNDGLARFATSKYKGPTSHNISNVYMHLTNYAVNKHSKTFVSHNDIGSKRKISSLNKWLESKNVDVKNLWEKIDEIIVKTILAIYSTLKHSYNTCFSMHDLIYACFELLGFDILLDWKLKPYLLEVNHSPSFHTDAQIDKDVKESLLMDTFEMLNLQQYDKKKIIGEDRKRIRERLLQEINAKNLSAHDCPSLMNIEKSDAIQCQFKWEDTHMGNFRRVYPGKDSYKYNSFFKQSATSMFQETAASRAREEALKLQREEIDQKLKEQQSKLLFGKWNYSKIGAESPRNFCKLKSSTAARNKLKSTFKKLPIIYTNKKMSSESIITHSFKPEMISEEDEKERLASMAERICLLKSQNIFQEVYTAMKLNGTLRPVDEKKYGLSFVESKQEDFHAETIVAQMSQCSCKNVPFKVQNTESKSKI